jgi:hypothetical protein
VSRVQMMTKNRGAAARSLLVLAALLALPSLVSAQQRPTARERLDARTLDHAIEIYVSDDAMQAQYIRTLDLGEVGPTELRAGFFYNEDRDLIVSGDLLARIGDLAEDRVIEVRAGTRVYGGFLATEDEDVFGVGLGGEAEYFLGRDRNTSIKLALFYAPDIATFGEADNLKDVSLRLQTQLRDGTDLFVGFRVFEIDMPVDREVDDNMHIGFRRSF